LSAIASKTQKDMKNPPSILIGLKRLMTKKIIDYRAEKIKSAGLPALFACLGKAFFRGTIKKLI